MKITSKRYPVKSSQLSQSIRNQFTMNGQARFWENDDPMDSKPLNALKYSKAEIDKAIKMTSVFELGHYGAVDTWIYLALERYSIKELQVGIIGSADQGFGPWYEAMVLSQGGIPTVIEYNKIEYAYDSIDCLTPTEIEKKLANGYKFDALLCISSIEHDGLTRYGDPLNPNGDLVAMHKLKSYLKPEGNLFLTCPVGIDSVIWNYHRIYGRARLDLLLSGWNIIDTFGFSDSNLDRDVGSGWKQQNEEGALQFPNYPSYEPLFVLQSNG